MVNQDVFYASKSGYSSYAKFFKTVSDEVGFEKALELHGSVFTDYGEAFDQMFREQSLEEVGASIGAMLGSMGYDSEITLTKDSVMAKTSTCPEYEGYKEAGLDHETCKKLCLKSINSIDETMKKLGSKGGVTIDKYRTGSKGYCIERFKVK
jgi:hypothetical protein